MLKTAVLLGATGFVGSELLKLLLEDPEYARVTVIVRRALEVSHPKLKVVLGDRHVLRALKDHLIGDELFLLIGAFRKTTPDPVEYYQIDHDYPLLAAELGKANGMRSVFVVTAIGGNAGSPILYSRMKGELERDLLRIGFEQTHIFRPSMILGNRKEHRPLEKAIGRVFRAMDPIFVGPLANYAGMDGADIARAILRAARGPGGKVKFYHVAEMRDLLV